MSAVVKWLDKNGFDTSGQDDWHESNIRRMLVGKVLGVETVGGEDYFDVEFYEGDPDKEFMLTCNDCRTNNIQFDVVAGDEVAVLVFDDMMAADNNSLIARKLTFEQVGIVLEQEAEKARAKAEFEAALLAEKEECLVQARAYVAELDAAGGLVSGVEAGENWSGFYLKIDGVEVPRLFAREVMDILAPRFQAIAEEHQAKRRIQYLKDNFTPEQLEIAVAAYHAE